MHLSTLENTAGVVVLYNPQVDVLANIATYLPDLAVLYCLDNSEEKNHGLIEKLMATPKVHYLDLQGNKGLAAALNKGAALAIKQEFLWLLTMDQDSAAQTGMIPLLRQALAHTQEEKVAIVAPFQQDKDNQGQTRQEGIQEVEAVMTSGNLLSLSAYSAVGPFKDEFFIDYLDYEFCLRLRLQGYKILQNPQAVLFHSVGDITLNSFLGVHITASNHSALRRYYITRNRLQVMETYKRHFPGYFKQEVLDLLKDVIRITFFEKDKLKKLRYMGYGIRDFRNRRFGKFQK
ncbi:glycosyltransferase family 2 protein [Rufibacter glacialis]|uniref:Glycosyltransferase family 2 protein n=1 Tax=Rufibacter glacialis TaxID=1259555 RepID=A0A5M8QHF8_9BACT|nr:glycosyltransferase family 2 protein [Rufibacter glacialis]KAA6434591.1 glycosyltransferase family 2 protein [Rufibacter glacialis]GGK70819.1 glycosyl transferase [Rufibacter glacialis]